MRKGDKPLRSGSKIDLGSIMEAAFAVLDADGYDGLTVRAVANRLNVHPPALYWHVKNRAELVTRMATTYMNAATQRESHVQGWSAMLTEFARGLREAMLSHKDSARLCLAAQPQGKPSDSIKPRVAPLISSGLGERRALLYQASIMAYTVGWVGYEQSPAMHEYLSKIIDFDASFEGGLEALLSGFEQQESPTAPPQKRQAKRRASAPNGRGKRQIPI